MQVLATMRRMGKPLPYDAEVEYLESTGTQYFDLGIKPNRDFVVRIKGKVATEVSNGYYGIFGRYIGSGGKLYHLEATTYYTSYDRFAGGGDGTTFGDYVVDSIKGYDFDITISATDTTVNGNPWWHGNMGVVNDDEKTLYLFASNGRSKFKGRIREFNISMNGEKVFDPIFVRVGTEGAMYDRVSGRLFRNAGTGAFVVGPDKYTQIGVLTPTGAKFTPTARNYVQDGLIAMWDGIENARWGAHDNTSVNEIVSNTTTTKIGSFTVGDKYILFNGSSYLSFTSSPICSAINNKSATVEIVGMLLPGNAHNNGVIGFGSTRRMLWQYIQSSNGRFAFRSDISYNTNGVTAYGFGRGCEFGSENEIVSISYQCSNSISIYHNGVFSQSGVSGENSVDNMCYIGKIGSYGIGKFRLYNLRCYNRPITSAEIAANHAIDLARFNLPTEGGAV